MVDKVHDTSGGPLHTSMSNKRNLANSDNVFNTSTNSATARNKIPGPAKQNIEQPTLDKQDVTPTAPTPPPIYISNILNFSAFTNELTRLTGPNAYTCKSTKSFLIVYPRGVLDYNSIITHLKETGASFHTFQARVNRSFRIAFIAPLNMIVFRGTNKEY
ncbi:hypothetical protein ACI65C_009127 [Semiaphis heraclei]